MLKGAALVIALLGFTEKVPLVCEGTATLNGLGEKPASMSVIIDLDAGTMETNLGVLTIALRIWNCSLKNRPTVTLHFAAR
jgi:hypothetical protein